MTMQIAVIDPFMKAPAINCFNGLVDLLKRPLSYFQPSQFGMEHIQQRRHQCLAYIVLGSASHVHENLPWHAPLASFLLEELKAAKPVLGCCFGHQLVCHALGAEIKYKQDENTKFQGKRTITIDHDFWNFKAGEKFELAVTHKQVVAKLVPGLKSVGTGFTNDVIIHETLPFLGTQAHPEASHHFSSTDITNLSDSDKRLVNSDGQKLILRFFQHMKLA